MKKIIVNKVPQKSTECVFANYAANYMICSFDNIKCCLDCNKECDKLVSFKNITIKRS